MDWGQIFNQSASSIISTTTIAYALGLPTDHEMYSPSGRPFKVAHKGVPVKALFT